MKGDRLSQREICRLAFPDWVVDCVLPPYPDEQGLAACVLKWLFVGCVLTFLVDEWLLPGLGASSAVFWIGAGVCGVILGLVPWERL
jgi:hypothetical protein